MATQSLPLMGIVVSSLALGVAIGYMAKGHTQPSAEKKEEEEDDDFTDYDTDDDEGDDGDEGDDDDDDDDVRYKMVLLVRTDIKKMKGGKMMAQCAHASLMAFQRIHRRYKKARGTANEKMRTQHRKWLQAWDHTGCAKIALKCPSQEQAKEIEKNAQDAGIPTVHVVDAGRTQIPAGTMTVVAIGPAPQEEIDRITRHLKLM